MLFHQIKNLPQFSSGETIIVCQANRIEPELGFAIHPFDVDVRRFIPFMGIKVKPIAIFSQDRRHNENGSFSTFTRISQPRAFPG